MRARVFTTVSVCYKTRQVLPLREASLLCVSEPFGDEG